MDYTHAAEIIAQENECTLISVDGNRARMQSHRPETATVCIMREVTDTETVFAEYRIQERIFRVMKDFRFFMLCLPAIYGMGRVEDAVDWVLIKEYEGETYQPAIRGVMPWTQQLAKDTAFLVFDCTQVPVLKFKDDVLSENYPERLQILREELTKNTDLQEYSVMWTEWLSEASAFFETKRPSLYTIQNGACTPENMVHLSETIVLNDWTRARITTVEDLASYVVIHAWFYPEWTKQFLKTLSNYLDLDPQWMTHMIRWNALWYALEDGHSAQDRLSLLTGARDFVI